MGVSLRCASGRRAAGYAYASVLRCATHCSRTLRMPHASCLLMFYIIFKHMFALPCLRLIIKYLQS
ncbi:MAG: hypothetical protein NZ455_09085 [Bacteroidia bacterium]|nr:hypothetical protein [Bacteroidia bacterium]MDW8346025.1 hypothetical protein [Bacteroidia bacterium]